MRHLRNMAHTCIAWGTRACIGPVAHRDGPSRSGLIVSAVLVVGVVGVAGVEATTAMERRRRRRRRRRLAPVMFTLPTI